MGGSVDRALTGTGGLRFRTGCLPTRRFGRAGRIRTDGLLLPKQARCQAAPQPDEDLF